MISLIILLMGRSLAQECFLPDANDDTKCQLCSIGYSKAVPVAFNDIFDKTDCVQSDFVAASLTYYVSSTCSSGCDGTSAKPFPNLLVALDNIPTPAASVTQPPLVTVLIKDQVSYILPSHISTGQIQYYNRRKLINLVIQPDPQTTFVGKPKIFIKTSSFSIFVAGQTTLSGFIVSGIGMNELPASFAAQSQITCTPALQASLATSETGILGTANTIRCGVSKYQLPETQMTEIYGLFTPEPIFDLETRYQPTLFIKLCTIEDFYAVQVIKFGALVQMALQLPESIFIQDTLITNVFFEAGIVSSLFWSSSISLFINQQSDGDMASQYQTYQSLSFSQVILQSVIISKYNSLLVDHFGSNHLITGSIISIRDQPLDLNITNCQYINSNFTDPRYFDLMENFNTIDIMGDGTSHGHYQAIIYTTTVLVIGATGTPIMSHLNVKKLVMDDVAVNAGIVFYASTSKDYFFTPNKAHNWIRLDGLLCSSSFIRVVLYWSNVDVLISNNVMRNVTANFIYYGEVFKDYNFVNKLSVTGCQFLQMRPFFVDDDFNEVNAVVYYHNSSVPTDAHYVVLTLQDILIQDQTDFIFFEGDDFEPSESYFINIRMVNIMNDWLIWSWFGCPFQGFVVMDRITVMDTKQMWQLINVGNIPPQVTLTNIYFERVYISEILTFRGSSRSVDDYVISIANFTIAITDEECYSNKYMLAKVFVDNARKQDISNLKVLGRVMLLDSHMRLCGSEAIFVIMSAFHQTIRNSTIEMIGACKIQETSTAIFSPIPQILSIVSTTIRRVSVMVGDAEYLGDPNPENIYEQKDRGHIVASTGYQLIINYCNFYDTGVKFTFLALQNSPSISVTNSLFNNIGFNIQSPTGLCTFTNLTMTSWNRFVAATYFFVITRSDKPVWVDNPQLGQGEKGSDVIMKDCRLYGNMTNGMIQLNNLKLYASQLEIIVKDAYLLSLGTKPIPDGLAPVSSPVILKENGWFYLEDSQMQFCSSSTGDKISCIVGFESSIIEVYGTKFKNSSSSFGSFVYGFGAQITISNCDFIYGFANKGGAIYLIGSQVQIKKCTFGQSQSIYNGGHIYADSSEIAIVDSLFQNGISLDSGSSIYGLEFKSLIISNTSFQSMYAAVQAVIYIGSPAIQQLVQLTDITLKDCQSNAKTVGLIVQRANLTLSNITFQSHSFKDISLISTLQSIALLNFVNLQLQDVSFLSCEAISIIQIQNSNGIVNNLTVIQSYFHKYMASITTSILDFSKFSLQFMSDESFIQKLISFNQMVLSELYRKTLFKFQSSTINLLDCSLQTLVLGSNVKGFESNIALLEIVSGIVSIDTTLGIIRTSYLDKYIVTNVQFSSASRRLLYETNVDKLLQEGQGKNVHCEGGVLRMLDSRLSNIAIATPLVVLNLAQFNITQASNQALDIVTKSVIDSFCSGTLEQYCKFLDFKITVGPALENQIFTIINSNFKSYGTSMQIESTSTNPSTVSLTNLNFQSRRALSQSMVLNATGASVAGKNLTIQDYSQPVTLLHSTASLTKSKIQSCTNGGISLFDSNLILANTEISNNVGISGGGLLANCTLGAAYSIQISDSIFDSNSATESGGAIRNINCPLVKDATTKFTHNTAPYGVDYLGYPDSILLHQIIQITDQTISDLAKRGQDISKTELKLPDQNQTLYVVGGQVSSFVINVIDNFHQIYPIGSYFNQKQIQQIIKSSDPGLSVILEMVPRDSSLKTSLVSYSFELISNSIIITEFYVFAPQNYVSASGANIIEVRINGILLSIFYIVVLPCPQGTISSSDRCFLCPDNTYSLNTMNDKCDICAKYQKCHGRNYLFADEGYYLSPNTSQPQQCPTMTACQQTVHTNKDLDNIFWIRHYKVMLENQTFTRLVPFIADNDLQLENTTKPEYCANGYTGAFCVLCETGYGQTSDGLCYQCSTSQTIYIQFVVSCIIILALNYKDSVEPLSAEEDDGPVLSGVLLKQLTDFTQLVNIVVGMIQNVSPDLLPALSILTDQISLFPSDFGSGFDCFFLSNVSDPLSKFKYLLLINAIIPWGFLIGLVLMILLMDKVKATLKYETIPKFVTLSDVVLVTLVANLYNFYFYLAQICLNIVSCVSINDQDLGEVQVLSLMTDVRCWERDHLLMVLYFGFPLLFIYVIGIPCMFAYFISKRYVPDEMRILDDERPGVLQLKSVSEHDSFIKGRSNDREKGDYVIIDKNEHKFIKSSIIESPKNEKQPTPSTPRQEAEEEKQPGSSEQQEEQPKVNYSKFLTENLKPEYKYWGIYVQFKKLLIITIMVITQSMDVATASIVVLIVFISFMLVSYKHQPYMYAKLNYFEGATDLLLTVIIHLSLLIIQSESKSVQIFAVLFIIILKFTFYYQGFKTIITEYLNYLKGSQKQQPSQIAEQPVPPSSK